MLYYIQRDKNDVVEAYAEADDVPPTEVDALGSAGRGVKASVVSILHRISKISSSR
jgi:hypothetical protein